MHCFSLRLTSSAFCSAAQLQAHTTRWPLWAHSGLAHRRVSVQPAKPVGYAPSERRAPLKSKRQAEKLENVYVVYCATLRFFFAKKIKCFVESGQGGRVFFHACFSVHRKI